MDFYRGTTERTQDRQTQATRDVRGSPSDARKVAEREIRSHTKEENTPEMAAARGNGDSMPSYCLNLSFKMLTLRSKKGHIVLYSL